MSPNTARWQQQINSSFEALVSGALMSPHSADLTHRADCSDWRYAVEDLRSVCPTIDDLQRKDWSLRHLEQRSDSRDSGLESDAAADRHLIHPTRRSVEDRRPQHTAFSLQQHEQLIPNMRKVETVAQSNSPTQLHMFTETENYRLYGALGKKKRQALLTMLQHRNADELVNGFTSYIPRTPDISGTAILQHQASAFALRDISRPVSSKSKCFTA